MQAVHCIVLSVFSTGGWPVVTSFWGHGQRTELIYVCFEIDCISYFEGCIFNSICRAPVHSVETAIDAKHGEQKNEVGQNPFLAL